jgi:hypothetical protein
VSANTQKGMKRFTDELIAGVDRAGAGAAKLLHADSGFWNTKVFERLEPEHLKPTPPGHAPTKPEGRRRRRRARFTRSSHPSSVDPGLAGVVRSEARQLTRAWWCGFAGFRALCRP